METFVVLVVIVGGLYALVKFLEKPDQKPEAQQPSDETSPPSSYNEPPIIYDPTTENIRIMQALVFIGKADGQLRENECEVIAEYLKSAQPEHQSTTTTYIGWQVRDMPRIEYIDYKKILKGMDSTRAQNFLYWAIKVVGTQNKVHPFEEVLLDNIKEYIADSQSEIKL